MTHYDVVSRSSLRIMHYMCNHSICNDKFSLNTLTINNNSSAAYLSYYVYTEY